MPMTNKRIIITNAAAEMIHKLRKRHGDLLFHLPAGCCDGSAPTCHSRADFKVGWRDILLGEIAGCPFYVGAAHFEYWKNFQMIIDLVPGRGGGLPPETPEEVRFIARSLAGEEESGSEPARAPAEPPAE